MREVVFVGPTQGDVRAFPDAARKLSGFALHRAQEGETHPNAKPLKGFGGAGVLEIVADSDGNTYRAVYTVRLANGRLRAACLPKEERARHHHACARDGACAQSPGVGKAHRRRACG